jgi:hypothetical protein
LARATWRERLRNLYASLPKPPKKALPARRGSSKARAKSDLIRRKVANLRRLLDIIVTAVKAGRSVHHTKMLD